jgi:hypothetical protein
LLTYLIIREIGFHPVSLNLADAPSFVHGGAEIVWGRTGEIFYRSGGRMMAARVREEPSLEIGRPHLLFEGSFLPPPVGRPTTTLVQMASDL